eukprot:1382302-Lingulodinium_polyedra.AAC.1
MGPVVHVGVHAVLRKIFPPRIEPIRAILLEGVDIVHEPTQDADLVLRERLVAGDATDNVMNTLIFPD